MVEVSASILDLKEEDSIKTLYNLETSNIDYFHVDVMDGKFVENNSADKMYKYSNYIKQISNLPIDVHLMVENVKKYVDEYLDFSPRIITFHIEVVKNKQEAMEIIKYIKECNCNVGISIKPGTKLEEIYELLPYIHLVLIMSVEPGKGGQTFIDESISKIKELKKYITDNDIDLFIEVDGGINVNNVTEIKDAGTDILVVGSALIKSDNYEKTVKELKKREKN